MPSPYKKIISILNSFQDPQLLTSCGTGSDFLESWGRPRVCILWQGPHWGIRGQTHIALLDGWNCGWPWPWIVQSDMVWVVRRNWKGEAWEWMGGYAPVPQLFEDDMGWRDHHRTTIQVINPITQQPQPAVEPNLMSWRNSEFKCNLNLAITNCRVRRSLYLFMGWIYPATSDLWSGFESCLHNFFTPSYLLRVYGCLMFNIASIYFS